MDSQNMNQNNNYQDNTAVNYGNQASVSNEPVKANALQIVSLVAGIVGIVVGCCFSFVGIIGGVVGIICAIMGNKQNKHGVGTAGLICSIIALVLGILGIILSAIVGAALVPMLSEMGYY